MKYKPKWLKVNSECNSECHTSELSALDWSEWWSDDSWIPGRVYLHVPRRDDDTVHRVFCPALGKVRLGWRDGELHWIVDPKP